MVQRDPGIILCHMYEPSAYMDIYVDTGMHVGKTEKHSEGCC